MKGTVPFAAGFCRGPDFASALDTLLQTASKGLSPPAYFVGKENDKNVFLRIYNDIICFDFRKIITLILTYSICTLL